jgi:twitching motility protein PilT
MSEEGQSLGIHQLLKTMVENNASDLHITTGSPPQIGSTAR